MLDDSNALPGNVPLMQARHVSALVYLDSGLCSVRPMNPKRLYSVRVCTRQLRGLTEIYEG